MDNIDYTYGSNGSGEPPRMTVTAARAPGATTLEVDALTNVPAKFVATTGTLDATTGLIDPATAKVFKGSISGSAINIDAWAPGYTDPDGSAVGQVVVLKPATEWADLVAGGLADLKASMTGDGANAYPVVFIVAATQPAPVAGRIVVWLQPI